MIFLKVSQESGIMMDLLRTILLSICSVVYRLIMYFYEIFIGVGDATILNSSQVQIIYNRVGLILGIAMMFRLIFSFVQYLLDPDKITDKETGVGGLIKKVIVVILALGLTNWVFEKAFEVQHLVLSENVLGKIVLGVSGGPDNNSVNTSTFAGMFAYEVFTNFYRVNPDLNESELEDAKAEGCDESFFDELSRYVQNFRDLDIVHRCVNVDGNPTGRLWGDKEYYHIFNGLEALAVGLFILWVIFMYTISLGFRVVKLAFLRIISPVPILSYLAPKKSNSFFNWIKQCVMTFLDVFIRLAVMYFAMLLISIILDPDRGPLLGVGTSFSTDSMYVWFKIILVLGVLLFAKKLPELLADLFPGMGGKSGLDLGFGFKGREMFGKGLTAAGGVVAGGAVGLIGGFAGGKGLSRFTGAFGGLTTGVGRGIGAGISGKGASFGDIRKGIGDVRKKQAEVELKRAQNIFAGYGLGNRMSDAMHSGFGAMSYYERVQGIYDSYKDIKSDIDDDDNVKNAEFTMQQAYNDDVQNNNYNGTFEDWKATARGSRFDARVSNARTQAFVNKYNDNKDQSFRIKVERHNKRFGTHYNGSTNWSTFNADRKSAKAAYENEAARKPRK